jgi:archaellum component FlaC
MQSEISGTKGEYGAVKDQLSQIRDTANELNEKLNKGEEIEGKNIGELREKLGGLSEKIKAMQDEEKAEREVIKGAIDNVKTDTTARFTKVESQLNDSASSAAAVRDTVKSMNDAMANIQEQIKGENKGLQDQVAEKMVGLQGGMDELSKKFESGQKVESEEIAQLRLAFESIARDVEDKAKIKDVSDLRMNIQKLGKELTESIGTQEKNLQGAKDLMRVLKGDMAKIQAQISGKTDEYSDLSAKVDSINGQITGLSGRIEAGDGIEVRDIVRLRGDINSLGTEVDGRAKVKDIDDDAINAVAARFKKGDDIDAISGDLKKDKWTPEQAKRIVEEARLKWMYA